MLKMVSEGETGEIFSISRKGIFRDNDKPSKFTTTEQVSVISFPVGRNITRYL